MVEEWFSIRLSVQFLSKLEHKFCLLRSPSLPLLTPRRWTKSTSFLSPHPLPTSSSLRPTFLFFPTYSSLSLILLLLFYWALSLAFVRSPLSSLLPTTCIVVLLCLISGFDFCFWLHYQESVEDFSVWRHFLYCCGFCCRPCCNYMSKGFVRYNESAAKWFSILLSFPHWSLYSVSQFLLLVSPTWEFVCRYAIGLLPRLEIKDVRKGRGRERCRWKKGR